MICLLYGLSMTSEWGWGDPRQLALIAAMCSVPMGVLMLVFSPVSAKIIRRYGPKVALGGGAFVLKSS